MSDLLERFGGLTWCDAAHDLADELAEAAGLDPDALTDDEYGDLHDLADAMLESAARAMGFPILDRSDLIPTRII